MADDNFTLTTFYTWWKVYQDRLKEALEPLTVEQLALRAAPDLRSIGENAMHIVGCRAFWFSVILGEDGGEEMKLYEDWNESALELGASVPIAAELARGLDYTWQFMAACLERWSPADMQRTFPDELDGKPVELSHAWVVWRVLQHDLHHGGEISIILGMHGIPAGFAI